MDHEPVFRIAEHITCPWDSVQMRCEGCDTKIRGTIAGLLRHAFENGWIDSFDQLYCGECCTEAKDGEAK